MLELFEFVLKLLEPISKLLKVLPFPPKIAGAVSILPPLIGALEVGWKFLQERGSEHKKRVLRERIVSLRDFLGSFPEVGLSEDQTQAAQDARREQTEAICQLARLASPVAEAVAEPIAKRSWIQRALLLYAPRPRAVWILHGLYYFFSIELLALIVASGVEASTGRLQDAGELLPVVGFFAVLVLIFWGLATDLDQSGSHAHNRLQRWLLAYAPARRGRWVWHMLFYLSLLLSFALLSIVPGLIREKQFSDLSAFAFWLLLLWIFRKAAVRRDRGEQRLGRLERWLLLYSPRKRWLWLLHIFFGISFIAAVAFVLLAVEPATMGKPISLKEVLELPFTLITTVIFWGLASDAEQGRQGPPGTLRRLLVLYIPQRRVLWILHVLFYLCVLIAFEGLGQQASGQYAIEEIDANTGQVILKAPVQVFAPVLYFVLLAIFSRAVAVRLEPWAAGIPRWIDWFWPGHLPHGWLRRSGFLLGALVFYGSLVLWPLLLLMGIDDLRTREAKTILTVSLPIIAAGLAGRWLARHLQGRQLLDT